MAIVKFEWIGGQGLISNIKDGVNTGDNYAGYNIPDATQMSKFKVGKKINVKVTTGEKAYEGEQTIIQIGNDTQTRMNMVVTDKVKMAKGTTVDLGSASGEIEVKPNLLIPIGIGVGVLGLITAVVVVIKKRKKGK